MAPTLVCEPFHRDGWVYEEKVDGWRMLAYKDRDGVRIVSRNGVNHTKRFPDLATAVAKLTARTLVLDGEIAIFDEQLRFRFDWLREPNPAAVATPPVYVAFDVMFRDGRILPGYRYRLGECISWTSLTALTLCFPRGAWRRMASMRGRKSSRAASRATSPRTRRASTVAAPRARGSRLRCLDGPMRRLGGRE